MVFLFMVVLGFSSQAQVPIIGTIIGKVIKAIDLKVQRMQNETIWLQNVQQVAEQELSKSKLAEITAWQQRQEDLYAGYFDELKKAKRSITGLSQVKRIISMQGEVMTAYNRFAHTRAFVSEYDALLANSVEILETLQVVVGAGMTMKDSDRITMITTLRDAMNQCLKNIKSLNEQQVSSAVANARLKADLQFVKRLNGIQ